VTKPKKIFDTHPYLIAVPGGYIDENGQLRDPDPGLLFSKRALLRPDIGVKCPKFLGLINHLSNHDKDQAQALKMALGYTLCGTGAEQIYFFLLGKGGVGKSQLLLVLDQLLDQYSTHAETQTFLRVESGHQRRSFDLSDLEGYWYVYASEFNHDSKMETSRVKMSTGGDGLHVEAKREHGRNIKTRFALWFAGNSFPRILDPDDAIYRRTMIFPCDTVLKADEVDLEFAARLVREEGRGIMATLLAWRAEYRRDRLMHTALMNEKRDYYVYRGDKMRNFAGECVIFDPLGLALRSAVYERFEVWRRANGFAHMSATEFYNQITEHALFKAHGCRVRDDKGNPIRMRLFSGTANNPQKVIIGLRLAPLEGFEICAPQSGTGVDTGNVLPFPEKEKVD
jgi:putative DNA primase/helicase